MRAEILGTTYEIFMDVPEDTLPPGADGLCDNTTKEIRIAQVKPDADSVRDLDEYKRRVLRHEIIHAFLFESGLHTESTVEPWATSEEMIDWLAIQSPKIFHVFRTLQI